MTTASAHGPASGTGPGGTGPGGTDPAAASDAVPAPGDETLTAAMLADSLDAVGLRHQVLAGGLTPLSPGMRAFGRAATIRFVPADETEPAAPYDDAIDAIDGLRPGEVVVIATGACEVTAYWGELFSAAARGAGAVGAVCDANVRDVAKIRALGFATFAAAARPIDFRGRMRVAAVREPVTVGGVDVADGDLVLADDDGVVVVPRRVEREVLELARARARAEGSVLTELLRGDGLREVWTRHGVL